MNLNNTTNCSEWTINNDINSVNSSLKAERGAFSDTEILNSMKIEVYFIFY